MRGLIYVSAKWPISQYYSCSLLRTKHEFYHFLFLRRCVKEHPIRNSLVHYYLCCNDTSHSAGAKELHLGTCPRRCVTPFQLHRGDWNLKNPVCDLIFLPPLLYSQTFLSSCFCSFTHLHTLQLLLLYAMHQLRLGEPQYAWRAVELKIAACNDVIVLKNATLYNISTLTFNYIVAADWRRQCYWGLTPIAVKESRFSTKIVKLFNVIKIGTRLFCSTVFPCNLISLLPSESCTNFSFMQDQVWIYNMCCGECPSGASANSHCET